MQYHCLRWHIRTFNMKLIFIFTYHTCHPKFPVWTNGIHKLSFLIHNNTFHFILCVNIKSRMSIHFNIKFLCFKVIKHIITMERLLVFFSTWIIFGILFFKFYNFCYVLYLLFILLQFIYRLFWLLPRFIYYHRFLHFIFWWSAFYLCKILFENNCSISFNDIFIIHDIAIEITSWIILFIKTILSSNLQIIAIYNTFTSPETKDIILR